MAESKQKLRRPSDILRDAWGTYKKGVYLFTGVYLIPVALLVSAKAVLWYGGADQESLALVDLFFFPAYLLAYAALLCAVNEKRENLSIQEAYKKGTEIIFSLFFLMILYGLAVVAGLILLIVPGMIMFIWFYFAEFVLVQERLKGVKALGQSKHYVRNYWFPVSGRILFIAFVMLLILLPIYSLAVFIPGSNEFFLDAIAQFLAAIFIPLSTIYSFKLFENLKEVKKAPKKT